MKYPRFSFAICLTLLFGAGTGLAAVSARREALRPLPAVAARPAVTPGEQTLLNDVGRLVQAVPLGQFQAWKHELKTSHPSPTRSAWLHVWLGEYELAARQEPGLAIWHFRQAQRVARRSDPTY